MDRYPFIVVEGLDGTGKTTLRKGLFRLFEGLYRITPLAVLTTNFLAPDVAVDLVDGKYQPTPDNQDRYLTALAADKQATDARLIEPSLPVRPVIADRWLLSELAFFTVKHGRPPKDTYAALTEHLGVVPDLTLVLDISPEAAMERAAARSGDATRPDWDVLTIQAKVRDVYQSVTEAPAGFPALGPVVRINAAQDRAVVLHTAWQALEQYGLLAELGGAAS
ncbi:thymidylate kinase [Streptomyces lunaelactis]|uniref:thymidylate kinase n=1 Tax=Streptomyces lunaelactis TaxID=1535768 RepID=UPI0015846E6C|nr:thymidylate kinase [Streptomyces lunaelactis]NUK32261.1 thymidylate kinase [Streptomyces lunaelactis]NUK41249.1 thymidylate kinase [Streptomyces lunaelactis]